MLSFFFRKNLYDGWDNLMLLAVPNLILSALTFGGGALMFAGRDYLALWILTASVLVCAASVAALAWAEVSVKLADGMPASLKDFFTAVPSCLADGLKYAGTLLAASAVTGIGGAYYFRKNATIVGLMAGSAFCWVSLTVFSALLWYPALRALMHNPFRKSVKKCFIIITDNPLKAVAAGLYNLSLALASAAMLGSAPGLTGLTLSRVNFLRLLLKKYDYLEKLDQANEPQNSPARRKIPWNDLLKNEIEMTGVRSFKMFVFPWKE